MSELAGHAALVTGGASGIGLALAEACASRGARVLLGDVRMEEASAAAEVLRRQGHDAAAVRLDVTSPEEWALAAARLAQTGDRLLLFNNAGVFAGGTATASGEAEWQRIMAVNFWGVLNGVRAVLPLMVTDGRPSAILNTASVAGLMVGGAGRLAAYTVSKHAVVALSECLQAELAGSNVQVSVFCPGPVATDLLATSQSLLAAGRPPQGADPMATGARFISPSEAAAIALAGLLAGRPIIPTHPEYWSRVEARTEALTAAFGNLVLAQEQIDFAS